MKLCRQCKTECTNEAKFCQECGYRFTEDDKPVKVCKNCNTHNSESSKFCAECGTPFELVVDNKPTITSDVKNSTTEGESIVSNTPKMTVDVVIENDYVVSSSEVENGSQTTTEEMAQIVEDAEPANEDITSPTEESIIVRDIPDEKLIEPDPDLRETDENDFQSGEVVTEIPVTEVQQSETSPNVEKNVETVVENQSEEQNNNVVEVKMEDIPPETPQTETENESEPVKQFSVKDIIANDSYYDDVPLGDDGVTKVPMDKEKKKEIALIIGGALFLITLITIYLVITG